LKVASKVTGAARKELAIQAYSLHVKRWQKQEIGKELGISRQLAATLIEEEQAERSVERDGTERMQAISTYEWVIREAAARLVRMSDRSLNVAGLMNVIVAAQKAIDDITGVEAQDRAGNADAAIESFASGANALYEFEMMQHEEGLSDFVYDEEQDLFRFPQDGRFAISREWADVDRLQERGYA